MEIFKKMLEDVLSLCVQIICIISCFIGVMIGLRIHFNWIRNKRTLSIYFRFILIVAVVFYWLALVFNTLELLMREIIGKNTIHFVSQFITVISYPALLFTVLIGIYSRLKQVFSGTAFQPSKSCMKTIVIIISFITISGAAASLIYGI